MSLWGSKKQNGDTVDENNADHADTDDVPRSSHHDDGGSSRREPTERDRLLPDDSHGRNTKPSSRSSRRPPPHDAYLDPDDPAVSANNLWSVRFLRYFTFIFLAITFCWWLLLLISIFISPPGLQTRGSGFFDFAYTSLSLGLLCCSLIFFFAPSMAIRVFQGVIALFLLVDLLIIVIVPRLRAEEGPPGLASVVWTFLIALWGITVDRIVTWGKHEEEERLTGRPETRRTLKEWLAVLTATIILFLYIAITLLMTCTLVLRARDATLEMDGHRYPVDNGKYEVHLACVGGDTDGNNTSVLKSTKSPTILLESSLSPSEYDFEHWAYAAQTHAIIPRYCYWDRPGYAWSDNAPSPHSAGNAADNLAEALARAGESGPYILVSAGYGSLVSRIFSSRHRRDIAGMLLIDPLHEDLLLARLGSPGRGFRLWLWGVLSPLGLGRVPGALFGGRSREDRVYGRDAAQGGKLLKAWLQEALVADSLTKSEVATARTIQSAKVPLVVVSSGIEVEKDGEWERKQEDLTTITEKLVAWDVVKKAGSEVWRDDKGKEVLNQRVGQLVEMAEEVMVEIEREEREGVVAREL